MIAEVKVTEMIDRLLNPIALANDENANGFEGERAGATVRSGNSHSFGLSFLVGRWVRKPKNLSSPTVKRKWGLVVAYNSASLTRCLDQRVWFSRGLVFASLAFGA
jgi:hypothetical protein